MIFRLYEDNLIFQFTPREKPNKSEKFEGVENFNSKSLLAYEKVSHSIFHPTQLDIPVASWNWIWWFSMSVFADFTRSCEQHFAQYQHPEGFFSFWIIRENLPKIKCLMNYRKTSWNVGVVRLTDHKVEKTFLKVLCSQSLESFNFWSGSRLSTILSQFSHNIDCTTWLPR